MPDDSNASNSSMAKLPRLEGIVFCVGFLLESLAIIVANTFTIVIFTRDRKLKLPKFYLMINLAAADMLVGVVCGPVWIYGLTRQFNLWPEPETSEKIWKTHVPETLELFTKYASLITLAMISAERMFATFFPVKHRSLKPTVYLVMIGICWLLAILMPLNYIAAMPLGLIDKDVGLYLLMAFTCVLLLTICVSYIAIWIKIMLGGEGLSRSAQDVKLTMSLFVVTVVSLATWLPCQIIFSLFLISMASSPFWSFHTYDRVLNSTALLLLANSLVNPIIYTFKMPQFRQSAVRLFCRQSRRRSYQEEVRLSSATFNRYNNALPIPQHLATADSTCVLTRSSRSLSTKTSSDTSGSAAATTHNLTRSLPKARNMTY